MSNLDESPVFADLEITKLESLAAWNSYYRRAYELVERYLRGAEPWPIMSPKARMWLWRIKGEMERLVK